MNEFESARISAHREYCTALQRITTASVKHFPAVISDVVSLYYNPSEEEHFIQVLSTLRISGDLDFDGEHELTMTLDPYVCHVLFSYGTIKKQHAFPATRLMIDEFDAGGMVDAVAWHLPRLVRACVDDECDWDIAKCEYAARQLATGFLSSYIRVANEQIVALR